MTARLLVGDVRRRLDDVPDGSIDLMLSSFPFFQLRSYLPADHPDKALEIGLEPTPAAYLDTILDIMSTLRAKLAPHGSVAIELGDTYAGSGGDSHVLVDGQLRPGQARYSGTATKAARAAAAYRNPARDGGALRDRAVDEALGVRPARKRTKGQPVGWPLDKSLCGIPTAFAWSLDYGRNVLREPLTARELLTEATRFAASRPDLTVADLLDQLASFLAHHEDTSGRVKGVELEPWRIRTLKPWIRTNPPVGALGDKERPATSYIVVATPARDRYFDLDAVRTPSLDRGAQEQRRQERDRGRRRRAQPLRHPHQQRPRSTTARLVAPRGRSHRRRAGPGRRRSFTDRSPRRSHPAVARAGRRPRHPRGRRRQRPGYRGPHFAAWPKELVRLLVDEMCPRRVCIHCGEPSRRLVLAEPSPFTGLPGVADRRRNGRNNGQLGVGALGVSHGNERRRATTLGWSHCTCGDGCRPTTWRKVRRRVPDENTGEPARTPSGAPRTRIVRVVDDPGHCAEPSHWRPGQVLDPFVGSGTTLEVCTGMARDAIGIDLDPDCVDLALGRTGMFLDVEVPVALVDDDLASTARSACATRSGS